MTDRDLAGRVAIVTGAGGGIGRAIALALIGRGARVAALDVRPEPVNAVCREAAAVSDAEAVVPLARDVSSRDDCAAAIRETIDAFNAVDILVNAAGLGMRTLRDDYWNDPVRFWEADIDRCQTMMAVNWHGAFMMARFAVPHMIEAGWGRIINVTTSLDTMCTPGYTPYGPSKAALEAATSIWARDLQGTGVTANVVVPGGPVNTGFIPENAPFDRSKLTQPEVMCGPVCWLCSSDADGITDRRYVARNWDAALPPAEAERKAGAPCAWPTTGSEAFKPYEER